MGGAPRFPTEHGSQVKVLLMSSISRSSGGLWDDFGTKPTKNDNRWKIGREVVKGLST